MKKTRKQPARKPKQTSAQLWLKTFNKYHAAAFDLETKTADGIGPKYLDAVAIHHYAVATRYTLATAEAARLDGDASSAAAFAFAAGSTWERLRMSMRTAPAVVARHQQVKQAPKAGKVSGKVRGRAKDILANIVRDGYKQLRLTMTRDNAIYELHNRHKRTPRCIEIYLGKVI